MQLTLSGGAIETIELGAGNAGLGSESSFSKGNTPRINEISRLSSSSEMICKSEPEYGPHSLSILEFTFSINILYFADPELKSTNLSGYGLESPQCL